MAITKERYGDKIRQARQIAELTQVQLADRLGVDQRTLSKWETDAAEPSWSLLKRIALACGVSADAILGVSAEIGGNRRRDDRATDGDIISDAEKSRFLQTDLVSSSQVA